MKTSHVFAFGLSVLASVVLAEGVYVGTGETVRRELSGVQADSVVIAPRGTLQKVGEGKWTLPTSKLAQGWDASVEVREGALTVDRDAPAAHAFADAAAILAGADCWFDASRETSFVKDDSGNVTDWLDARETPGASPYAYARAHSVTEVSGSYPVVQTAANGMKGLYFRGYPSGCYANLLTPSGSQKTLLCYNVFAVHGHLEKLGTIFGTRKGLDARYTAFVPGSTSGAFKPLWNALNGYPMNNARTYVNGEEVDAFTSSAEAMPAGFSLLEAELLNNPGGVQCFFNDRDYWYSRQISGYQYYSWGGDRIGGEYLCEVVLFTRRLTSAERLAVEGYLMEKWFGTRHASALSVTAAKGTSVEVTGSDASVPVTVSGGGAFAESGTGVRDIAYAEDLLGFSAYRAEGMTLTGFDLVPYFAASGESVEVSEDIDGLTLGRTAAADGQFVKTGAGRLVLRGLPTGVKELTVLEGELSVGAACAPDPDPVPPENLVSNGSFEVGMSAESYYQKLGNGSDFYGWHITTEGSDMTVWVNHSTHEGGYNKYNQYMVLPETAPDGGCVLVMTKNAAAWTEVRTDEAGDYEVSFWLSTRMSSGQVNQILGVSIGEDAESMVLLGSARPLDYDGRFARYRLSAKGLKARTAYRLRFAPLRDDADRAVVIDDVRVCKTDADRPFEIPNGDFEYFKSDEDELTDPFVFSSANSTALLGWTLTANLPGTVVSPVFVKTYSSAQGVAYSGLYFYPQDNENGVSQLFMGLGTQAAVTFVPPAGTYRVRAKAALRVVGSVRVKRGDFSCNAKVGAGADTSLGSFRVADDMMLAERLFPTAFTVDGTTPVTLTLKASRVDWNDVSADGQTNGNEGFIVDDVELVPETTGATSANLIRAPGFDSGAKDCWTGFAANTYDSGWGAQHFIGGGANLAGNGMSIVPQRFCAANNEYYLRIHGSAKVTQTVSVPDKGAYRFSAWLRKRVSTTAGVFSSETVRFWLAKGGVTNVIGSVLPASTNFCRHVWTTDVPESGDWTLGVQSSGGDWSIVDELALVREDVAAGDPGFDEDAVVRVAAGAKLDLRFTGTKKVQKVRLGGRPRSGLISAETDPEFLSGPGELWVEPKGMTILIR